MEKGISFRATRVPRRGGLRLLRARGASAVHESGEPKP